MKLGGNSPHSNTVIQHGSNTAFLASSLAMGAGHLDCARTYLALQDIAETKASFFKAVTTGALVGDKLIEEANVQGLAPKTVAAVLYTIFKKQPHEIQATLNSETLRIKFPRVAGSIIDSGIKEVSAGCGVSRPIEMSELWDYPQQQKCIEFVRKVKDWVSHPFGKTIPNDVIELPISCLTRILPWIEGREEQLRDTFKDLILSQIDPAQREKGQVSKEPGTFGRSAGSSPVFAWLEVNSIGAIILNISVNNKDFKTDVYNPLLARYMIGAACGETEVVQSKAEYTRARLLLSRTESNARMKALYPEMPKNQRAFQESLTMAVGGAIELSDFERARHLKVAQQVFQTTSGPKLSRTATLTIISSLLLAVPEKRTKIDNPKLRKVTRRCRATVGIPSAISLDCGMEACHVKLTRETTKQVARTGEFVASRFALYGLTEGRMLSIGSLYFKSRNVGKIPRFEFEPLENNLNHRQISKWRQTALKWLTTTAGSMPAGYCTVPVISNPDDKNLYCDFAYERITLSSLPEGLKSLTAYPAKVRIEGEDKKVILLFSESGKVEAAIHCSEDPKEKAVEATSAYMTRFIKRNSFVTYWGEVKKKGSEIWLEHVATENGRIV